MNVRPRTHLPRSAWLPAAISLVAASTLIPSAVQAGSSPSSPLQWEVLTLPPPVAATPFSYAEPGIVISSDGTAIADAATANTGAPPTAWVSRDSGSSWTPGQAFDITGASTGDADVAIGADGVLYALDLAFSPNAPGQPTNPTVFVFGSPDGVTWQGPASFPAPHGLDQPDRPWLLTDPHNPSDVDVVNSEGGGNIVMWRSQDHGASFSGPILVSSGANSQAALALSNRPLFDPTDDQRIFMLYETVTPAGLASTLAASPPVYEFPMTQLWLAVSVDAGASWSNSLVLDTAASSGSPVQGGTVGHLLVASAVDPEGHLYAAFSLRPAGATETDIYLTHSTDHGVSWSAPADVGAATPSNVMPALAVGQNGTAYLSWYGSADNDFRDGNATWFEMFAMSDDPLADQPTFVFSRVSGTPLHVGGIDTAGTIGSNLGANWGLRDFQSIAVDRCDQPHPVWAVDDGPQETRTAMLTGVPCALPGTGVPESPWLPLLMLSAAGSVAVAAGVRRAQSSTT